jgi:uncharacterized caspase-like protein
MRRRVLRASLGALACGSGLFAAPSARSQTGAAQARVALVLGNGGYATAPLANAVSDARRVASAVAGLGFGVVMLEDAGRAAMVDAIRGFYAASEQALVRMLYFAGHGAQYRGRNFLIPTDAALRSEDDLPRVAIDAVDIADRLSRFPAGVSLVVLDACRSAPIRAARTRGLEHRDAAGLASMVAPRGTIIAYSTAPGRVAEDGAGAGTGPYARRLAEEISAAGVPIEEVFKRVRVAVMRDTNDRQVPWDSSSLVGELCLRAGADGRCGSAGSR